MDKPQLGTIQRWIASDGYEGFYRRYRPAAPARGIVVCLHGIQSHGGWYEHTSSRLAKAGYEVAFLDRRGSGLNFAHRGDAPSFHRLLDDVAEFIDLLKRQIPERKDVTLHACSWGAKLAVGLCLSHPNLSQRLILIGPGFFPQVGVSLPTKLRIGRSKVLRPTRGFDIPLNDPTLFTASEKWRTFLRHDPLALHQATARLLVESVRLDRFVRAAAASVNVPVLLLLAGQDRIIRNAPTREFVQGFASADKQIKEYEAAHHTLEFEPDVDRILDDQVGWLEARRNAI